MRLLALNVRLGRPLVFRCVFALAPLDGGLPWSIARVTLGLRGRERLSVGARVAAGTWLPQVTFLPRGARLVLAALLILGAGVAGLAGFVATGNVNVTSASRPENKYTGVLAPYACASDADGDGVDDQTDILSAALRYVQTKPVYRSEYYTGGYPDDGCGVCTDVVAFALRDAGYDLQALVATDITEHPDDYGLDAPDPAIDFRRVRNLKVFFARHAAQLTCDVHAIDEWQGGDIAIFDSHIGIVSDRRNENGVPYLIHHNAPSQLSYEEDVLEGRDDLVMHVRMGCE